MRRWYAQPVPWGIFVFTILLLGVVFGVGVAFAVRSAIDSHDAKTAAIRQSEGRAIAIDVLCGFSNGVAEAGRKALAGELQGQNSGAGCPRWRSATMWRRSRRRCWRRRGSVRRASSSPMAK
jgi:hypothetical protein